MKNNSDYVVMFFIMLISGLFSTMNMWVDKYEDIRVSLNDLYMIFLMTGWMFLLTGIYYKNYQVLFIGLFLVLLNLWCIRSQFMVSIKQYYLGMIPHHSMAIHMSKKILKNNPPNNTEFISNIINTQEKEIEYIKSII
jgi:hypothetical protein